MAEPDRYFSGTPSTPFGTNYRARDAFQYLLPPARFFGVVPQLETAIRVQMRETAEKKGSSVYGEIVEALSAAYDTSGGDVEIGALVILGQGDRPLKHRTIAGFLRGAGCDVQSKSARTPEGRVYRKTTVAVTPEIMARLRIEYGIVTDVTDVTGVTGTGSPFEAPKTAWPAGKLVNS